MAMADKPISSYEAIAIRLNNAEKRFTEYCMEHAGLTADEASEVLGIAIRHKLIKLCPATGQFHAKHGCYLDADFLQSLARRR